MAPQKTADQTPETAAVELHPDELWMEEALRCAQRALEAAEVPVGAVVVCNGQLWDADGIATSRPLTPRRTPR